MLVVALCFVFGQSETYAEDVDWNRYITLTVKKGAKIRIRFATEDLPVSSRGAYVKGVKGDGKRYIPHELLGWQEYEATGTEVTIYGHIEIFGCSGNRGKITRINLEYNGAVEQLDCSNNQLSALDVSKCKYLKKLDCSYNQFFCPRPK